MGIGQKKDRRYLLESIIKPNAQIAPGFDSVLLKLKGNVTVGGILKKETDKEVSSSIPMKANRRSTR